MKTSPNIRSMVGQEGAVLRNVKTGTTFGLNPVGAEMWKMLQQGIPVNEIVVRISVLYDAPEAKIESDLRAFIQKLQNSDLIILDDTSP